jgi:hypothetical protein
MRATSWSTETRAFSSSGSVSPPADSEATSHRPLYDKLWEKCIFLGTNFCLKRKFALEQARKAQTGSKGIALLFLYRRRERSRPYPGRFTPRKRSLLFKIQKTQEAKFVPGNAIKSYRVSRQVVLSGQFYSCKETGTP